MFPRLRKFLYDKGRAAATKLLIPAAQRYARRRVARETGENDLVIVYPFALGDTLYSLAYLEAIARKYPEKRFIFVTYNKYKSIVETFHPERYVTVYYTPGKGRAMFVVKSIAANIGNPAAWLRDRIINIPFGIMSASPDYARTGTDFLAGIRKFFHLEENTPINYLTIASNPPPINCLYS